MDQDRNTGTTVSALLGPATLLIMLTLFAPLVMLARFSLNQYDRKALMIEAVTSENFVRFLTDPFYANVLWTTLSIAFVSTIVTIVIGFPIAYRLARMQSRWKSVCVVLVILPLFIGSTVRAVGWIGILGHNGLVDAIVSLLAPHTHLNLLYSSFSVTVGIISIHLAYMIITLQSVLESIDIRVEEAANNLGAGPVQRLRLIVLPLAMPGILTGAILIFILAMNAYATPLLLGGARFQMMAPMLFNEFSLNNNWPFAAALAFILMATSLVLTGLASFGIRSKTRLV